ncbi:hydrogenase iron-sulfur subunit [bacterium]|nr:hydrogenase iron-sulfur subunit [bacterium]MBU1615400.1 hydrogenase iron-sulfur subunit [bacterium]
MGIRLFLCRCNGEIELPDNIDFGQDVEITIAEQLCSQEGRQLVSQAGQDIVLAGCTERVAEKFFADKNITFVNIREQGSYIGASTQKITDLIKASLQKVRAKENGRTRKYFEIKNKSALVVGGGIAGLEAAKQIALAGIKVYLLEKEPFLGGLLAKLDRLYPEGSPGAHTVYPLINSLLAIEGVETLTSATLLEVKGELGDYRVRIKQTQCYINDSLSVGRKCQEVCPVEVKKDGIIRKAIYYCPTHPDMYAIDTENCNKCGRCKEIAEKIDLDFEAREIELEVGAIVVATGLIPYPIDRISQYGYGRYENVLTPLEFELKVTTEEFSPKRVVIITCVGSRDENHLPYCSSICCFLGLKEAKLIKDTFPSTEVYLCYIDMRAYGEFEQLYSILRKVHGVHFIQGKPSEVTRRNGNLLVRVEDVQLGELLEIEADCVVLSHGFRPDEETLGQVGIRVDGHSFPENYIKASKSIDSNPRGIFICGGAAFPKAVFPTISEARDVAVSVINLLSKEKIEVSGTIPEIDSAVCSELECRICVSSCPYGAIKIEAEELKVDPSTCMGCGICSATCGASANQLQGETSRQLLAQVKALAGEDTIIAFLCKWCAYPAIDTCGYERLKYPDSVRIIKVACTGRVSGDLIMEAFSKGAKGVLVSGCYPDACHYVSGNLKARKRVFGLEEMIVSFGIDKKRLRIEWVEKREGKKLVRILEEMDKLA